MFGILQWTMKRRNTSGKFTMNKQNVAATGLQKMQESVVVDMVDTLEPLC